MTPAFWTILLIGLISHDWAVATEHSPLSRECANRVFEIAGQDNYVNALNRKLQHLHTRNGARGPSVLADWNATNTAQGRTGTQTQQFIDSHFASKTSVARRLEDQLCRENVLYQRAHNSVTHFPLAECQRRLRACALALSRPSGESTAVTCRDAQVRIPNQTVWNNYLDSLYKSEMLREMHEDSDAARTGVLANGQNCSRDWVPESRANLADPGSATGTAEHQIDPCTGTTVCATCTLDENASGGGFSQLRDFARSLGHEEPTPRDWRLYWQMGDYYKQQLKSAYVKALAASVFRDCQDWRANRDRKMDQVGQIAESELEDTSRRTEFGTDAGPSSSIEARVCTATLFGNPGAAADAVSAYMSRSCQNTGSGTSAEDTGSCPDNVQSQITQQLRATREAGQDPFARRRRLIAQAASKAGRIRDKIYNDVRDFSVRFDATSSLRINWNRLKRCSADAASCLRQNCMTNQGRGAAHCSAEQSQPVLALVESIVTLNQLRDQLRNADRALATTITREVRLLRDDRQVDALDAMVAQRSQAGCSRDEGSQSCTQATDSAISEVVSNQRRQIVQGLQGMCGFQNGTSGGFNRIGRHIALGEDRASQELFFRWARTAGRSSSRSDLCHAVRGARHDDSVATLEVLVGSIAAAMSAGAAVPLMGGGALTAVALSMGVDLASFLADTMPRLEQAGSFSLLTRGAQQACVASAAAVLTAQENYRMMQLMSVAEILLAGGFAGLEARSVLRGLGEISQVDNIIARADRLRAMEEAVEALRATAPARAIARETASEGAERVTRETANEGAERVTRETANEGVERTTSGSVRRATTTGELTAAHMPRSMPSIARNNPEIRVQWTEAATALGCTNPARCPALEETYRLASRAPTREVREALNLGRESLTQQEKVMLAEIRAHLTRQTREAAQLEGRELTERQLRQSVDSQLVQRFRQSTDELVRSGVCAVGAAGAR